MCNFISDKWIPAKRLDGSFERIAPYDITSAIESDNPIVSVCSPRSDFDGAIMQFIIGLTQSTMAPSDNDVWRRKWRKPPTTDELKTAFMSVSEAFDSNFMRDLTLKPEDCSGGATPVEQLLLDFRKEGSDVFAKSGVVNGMCCHCLHTAIFALQTNSPMGGVGYRVSIRGGGPLTTIITSDTLWQTIWLNVIPLARRNTSNYNTSQRTDLAAIFPWLAQTITSEGDRAISPSEAHPDRVYWAMPRRIVADDNNTSVGTCDICHQKDVKLYHTYFTKNYGEMYSTKIGSGAFYAWTHPLTYYNNREKSRTPILAKANNFTYDNYPLLAFGSKDNGSYELALNVNQFKIFESENTEFVDKTNMFKNLKLWVFGYEFNQNKAEGWHNYYIPLLYIGGSHTPIYEDTVTRLAKATVHIAENVQRYVYTAIGSGMNARSTFFSNTEDTFYTTLYELEKLILSNDNLLEIKLKWLEYARKQALSLYDELCHTNLIFNDSSMEETRKIVESRNKLRKAISNDGEITQSTKKTKKATKKTEKPTDRVTISDFLSLPKENGEGDTL